MVDPTVMLKEIDFLNGRISTLNTENVKLQSTITDKDAEILRLRSLLKEVKEGFENDIFGVLPNGNEAFGYDEGLVMGGEFLTALMEKLKQEGV